MRDLNHDFKELCRHNRDGSYATRADRDFPRALSRTGLFASTKDHAPALGVVAYDVNAPLWSDHALGEHLLALPGTSRIEVREKGELRLPEGSVLVRQVYAGSPASAQGVVRGDVITEVNGTHLRGAQDLMARVAMLKPGQGVRLSLWRGPPFEGPLR